MELTINKKSWHYRWFKYLSSKFRDFHYSWQEPVSLCPYFWRFLYNHLRVLVTLIVALVLVALIAVVITLPILGYFYNEKVMYIGLAFYMIFAIFVSVMFAFYFTKEKLEDAKYQEDVGSFWVIIYSIKNKVCPMIKYKNIE